MSTGCIVPTSCCTCPPQGSPLEPRVSATNRERSSKALRTKKNGPRSWRRPLGLDDGPRKAVTRHRERLQPKSYLAILSHHDTQTKDGQGGNGGNSSAISATQQRRSPPTLGSPRTR